MPHTSPRPGWSLVAAAVLAGPVVAEAQQPPPFAAATWLGEPAYAYHPTVVTDGRGRWLVFWSSTLDQPNLGPDADIVVRRSEDHGRTWSPLYPVSTGATTDTEPQWITDTLPAAAADGQGTWMVAWQAWGGRDARNVLVATSRDDGRTFEAPHRLRGPGREVTSSAPHLATDGRGQWIVAWTSQGGDAGPDYDVFFSRSLDNGRTWLPPRPAAPYVTTDNIDDLTPRLATDGRGTWVIVWSAAVLTGPDYDVVFIRSRDDGRTWSDPVPLNDDALRDGPPSRWTADDFDASIATDGDGTWLVTWASHKDVTTDEGRNVYFARSNDQGATWSTATRLSPADPQINERPWVANNGRDRWLIGWSGRNDDRAAQIFVTESSDDGVLFSSPSTVALGNLSQFDRPSLASDGISGWAITARGSGGDLDGRIAVAIARGDCGDGQVVSPEVCDAPDGCCAPNCALRAAGFVCRPATGACDVAEVCSGVATACGPDVVRTATVVCRAATGPCDADERCDGAAPSCPDDAVASDGTLCGSPSPCVQARICEAGMCAEIPRACDDDDPCTADACGPQGCVHEAIAGCCTTDDACDDADPCTLDRCEDGECRSTPNMCLPDAGMGVDAAAVPPPPPADLEGAEGCGCRAGPRSRGFPASILVCVALLGGALLAKRRSRVKWTSKRHALRGP